MIPKVQYPRKNISSAKGSRKWLDNLPHVGDNAVEHKRESVLTKQLFYPRDDVGSWPWPENRPSTSPVKKFSKVKQSSPKSSTQGTSLLEYKFLQDERQSKAINKHPKGSPGRERPKQYHYFRHSNDFDVAQSSSPQGARLRARCQGHQHDPKALAKLNRNIQRYLMNNVPTKEECLRYLNLVTDSGCCKDERALLETLRSAFEKAFACDSFEAKASEERLLRQLRRQEAKANLDIKKIKSGAQSESSNQILKYKESITRQLESSVQTSMT